MYSRIITIENLKPRQRFVMQNFKFTVHAIEEFFGKVWIETTTGSLICERAGSYVEV